MNYNEADWPDSGHRIPRAAFLPVEQRYDGPPIGVLAQPSARPGPFFARPGPSSARAGPSSARAGPSSASPTRSSEEAADNPGIPPSGEAADDPGFLRQEAFQLMPLQFLSHAPARISTTV